MPNKIPFTFDWWVTGYDPATGGILVKSRTTKQTGVVTDPTEDERISASVTNFEPYPWIYPDRVTVKDVPAIALKRSRNTQRLSGIIKITPDVSKRIE